MSASDLLWLSLACALFAVYAFRASGGALAANAPLRVFNLWLVSCGVAVVLAMGLLIIGGERIFPPTTITVTEAPAPNAEVVKTTAGVVRGPGNLMAIPGPYCVRLARPDRIDGGLGVIHPGPCRPGER